MVPVTRGLILMRAWLSHHKATQAELAFRAGIQPIQVQHIVSRRRLPSFRVAFAIQDGTDGDIDARAWLESVD